MSQDDSNYTEQCLRAYRRAKKPANPWLRILDAYHRGRGVRLSAEEVERLYGDDAIHLAAINIAANELELDQEDP